MNKLVLFLAAWPALAQPPAPGATPSGPSVPATTTASPSVRPPEGRWDEVLKAVDDLMWNMKLSDIADVDKVMYTSLPPQHALNPNEPGATNPLIIRAYTFIPKK